MLHSSKCSACYNKIREGQISFGKVKVDKLRLVTLGKMKLESVEENIFQPVFDKMLMHANLL